MTSGAAITIDPQADLERASAIRRPARLLWLLAAVMSLAFPIYLATLDRYHIVGYVSDDAYYYFNVAAHLAQGHGPTADGVTTTTGFHPLYAFALAAIHRLTDPSLDAFVREAVVFNAVCHMLAGLFLYLAARRWWGRLAGLAAAALWLTNPHANLIMSVGLEGSVYSVTLAALLWGTVAVVDGPGGGRPARTRVGRAALIGLLAGLVLLSRTDALALIPLLLIVVLLAPRHAGWPIRILSALVCAVVAVAMTGLWWAYAYAHTGQWVQGSAAIKTLWRPEVVEEEMGAATLLASVIFALLTWGKYVLKCFFKVPALKWALSGVPDVFRQAAGRSGGRALLHTAWIFPAGIGLAYALLIDRPRTWYYVPALVLLTWLTAGAAAHLLTNAATSGIQSWSRRFAPLLVWLVLLESAAIFGRNVFHPRSEEQVMGVLAAQWVSENVDAETRIGCWHSGIVQYYSPDRTVINLDGLANNEILAVLRGEKTMNAYWGERDIRILLGHPRQKMGGFANEWNGRKLEWVPGVQGVRRVVPNPEGVSATP